MRTFIHDILSFESLQVIENVCSIEGSIDIYLLIMRYQILNLTKHSSDVGTLFHQVAYMAVQ